MHTINVAIAGFGLSGRVFHTPFLKNDPRFKVCKVFERSSNNAAAFLPEAEIVRSFEALLTPEIELIIITTPNQTHFSLAKQAILAKKHVLVEKPLATNAQEARELAHLAAENNVKLAIYQNRRWDNSVLAAKHILNEGLIGKAVDAEIRFERYAKEKNSKVWKETGEQGTGLVYDLGVHLIDLSLDLFGKPQRIFADIRYQHEGAISDDNFQIDLWFDGGLKVHLSATKYAREPLPHFALHGTLGSFIQQNVDPQEARLNAGTELTPNWYLAEPSEWGILHSEKEGKPMREPFAPIHASYQHFYNNLYQAIAEDAPLLVTVDQAINVLEIIEKAFESARLGKILQLDLSL